MATHKSAFKRMAQNEANRQRNLRVRSLVKSRVKKLREFIQAKDLNKAKEALSEAVREINRARSKGVLHRNTASRKISRLTQEFNTLGPS